MKVKELIKELQKLDKEMPVVAEVHSGHEGIGVATASNIEKSQNDSFFINPNIVENDSIFMRQETLQKIDRDSNQVADAETLLIGIYDYEDGEIEDRLSVIDDHIEYFNKGMEIYFTDIPETKEEVKARLVKESIRIEKENKRQELLEKQAEIEKELEELSNN